MNQINELNESSFFDLQRVVLFEIKKKCNQRLFADSGKKSQNKEAKSHNNILNLQDKKSKEWRECQI